MSSAHFTGVKIRRKKNAKKGVDLSLMVCGASGTGRTTFVNTLCGMKVLQSTIDDENPAFVDPVLEKGGVKIIPTTVELDLEDDENTEISLTIVDTPGFGDQIDNEASFAEIIGYLETQYDDILALDCQIKRKPRFRDNRVHACLYFIEPTGHGLRELDVELMRRLSPRVNVIPIIGKADSLTPSELAQSKSFIMEDIVHYQIPIYDFPYNDEEDDEERIEQNEELRTIMPFAVIGSEDIVEVCGEMVRARQYPWGVVDVENPLYSDMAILRNVLLHSHVEDLKSITHDLLYENYRTEKLSISVEGGVEGDYSMSSADLALQAQRLQEEHFFQQQQKLQELEAKIQQSIIQKRQELLARETQLSKIENRMMLEQGNRFEAEMTPQGMW